MTEAKLERIRQLIQTNRVDDALKMIQNILADESENAKAFSLMCWAYSKKGENVKALNAVKEALRITSYSPSYKLQMARVYLIMGRFGQAHEVLDQMGWLAKESAAGNEMSSLIYFHQGKLEEALKWAENGLALSAEDVGILNLRVQILSSMGQNKTASKALDSIFKISPENSTTHFNKGRVLLLQSKYEEAVEFFKESLRLSPNHKPSKEGMKYALKMRMNWYRKLDRAVKEDDNPSPLFLGILLGIKLLFSFYCIVADDFRPLAFFLGIIVFFPIMKILREPLINLVLVEDPVGKLVVSEKEIDIGKIAIIVTTLGVFLILSGGFLYLLTGIETFLRVLIFGYLTMFMIMPIVDHKKMVNTPINRIKINSIIIFIVATIIIFSFPSVMAKILLVALFLFLVNLAGGFSEDKGNKPWRDD